MIRSNESALRPSEMTPYPAIIHLQERWPSPIGAAAVALSAILPAKCPIYDKHIDHNIILWLFLEISEHIRLTLCLTQSIIEGAGGDNVATRGRPIVGVRLDRIVIDNLKAEAEKRRCTMTDIISDLVKTELKRCGYSMANQPIEGQVRIE